MHVKKGSRERSTAGMLCSLKGKVLQLPLERLWTAETQLNLHLQLQSHIRYFPHDVLEPRLTPWFLKFRGSIQRMRWHSSTVPELQSRCIKNCRKQDSVLKNLSSLLPLFTSGFAHTRQAFLHGGFGKATATVLFFWVQVSSSFLLLRPAALRQAGALGGTLHSSTWQLGLCRCFHAAHSARKGEKL